MSSPTRAQILGLYRQYLATAQSFSSYNFRTYFLRRSRDLFRSTLLPPQQAAASSPFSKAGDQTTPASPSTLTSPPPPVLSNDGSSLSSPPSDASNPHGSESTDKLKAFYATALKDLEVLRRAALTNRMYEGEKLVVERPQLIIGGGGAGQEASTGGAGQPTATPQSAGGAPKSD
ncbi:unnamed protein product [Jaminaea pallidilutea]